LRRKNENSFYSKYGLAQAKPSAATSLGRDVIVAGSPNQGYRF